MPKKRYGQHFLSDPAILERIVQFARVPPEADVVELGPGRGTLTRLLAVTARRLIAVEVDRDLVPGLRRAMPANVEIMEQDALGLDFGTLMPDRFHLVGNLPFNIATPLLERFIRARDRITAVTIMVQKEVADRIAAEPGSGDYGPLSVGIQYYAEVEPGFLVQPGSFDPPPKVHSRLLRLTWNPETPDAPRFIRFVRSAFSSRRKKLLNNLAGMQPGVDRNALTAMLENLGLNPSVRPEQLSVDQFFDLYNSIREQAPGPRTPTKPI